MKIWKIHFFPKGTFTSHVVWWIWLWMTSVAQIHYVREEEGRRISITSDTTCEHEMRSKYRQQKKDFQRNNCLFPYYNFWKHKTLLLNGIIKNNWPKEQFSALEMPHPQQKPKPSEFVETIQHSFHFYNMIKTWHTLECKIDGGECFINIRKNIVPLGIICSHVYWFLAFKTPNGFIYPILSEYV
jgi:hypothetical protein